MCVDDIVGCVGGEEFLVFLLGVDVDGVFVFGECICSMVECEVL